MSLKKNLEGLLDGLAKKDSENVDKDSGKISFLILDRTVDLVTPIMHDYYYQSMIYDLLNIENNIV